MTADRPPAALLQRLVDPRSAEAAASELAARSAWLRGVPPPEILAAIGEPENPYDGAVAGLVRAWRQADLLPALAGALSQERSVDRRRRLAWAIKQVCTEDLIPALLPYLHDASEDRIVRRYLLEAITHCTACQQETWPRLERTVRTLLLDQDPLIREGATALAGAGDGHAADRRALLISRLEDEDAAVVATALSFLPRFGIRKADLSEGLARRLAENSDPRVRLAVSDLLKSVDNGSAGY